jgi:C-terminal processing protease CtpA/Prc
LWLTYVRYLTPDNDPIHETGLTPDLEVEQPEVEFGSAPPAADAALQKALDHLAQQ